MPTKRQSKKRNRQFGSPTAVHEARSARAAHGAQESLGHARDAMDRGDCGGALADLLDAKGFVSVAGSEAEATRGETGGNDRAFTAASRLRKELAGVSSDFHVACVRSRRK